MAGILIGIGFPAAHYAVNAAVLQRSAGLYAQKFGEKLQDLVLADPILWKYQAHRYDQILDNYLTGDVTVVRVRDETGQPVAGYEHKTPQAAAWWNGYAPVGSAPIVFNGRPIGSVEVAVSQGDLVAATFTLLLVCTAAGAGLALLFYAFPVRVVTGMERRIRDLLASTQEAYDELSRTQAQLTQAQKMEAVGRLAGGVAHDFNNLLTVIGGRTELLLGRLGPDDPLRRSLDLIHQTVRRAAELTHQLLAFSRKQVLQPKVVDLNDVVAGIDPMLRRLIGEDVQLVTLSDPALGCVNADPGQLGQVILNLAVNARDAMPNGGRLTLETANVDLDRAVHPRAGAGRGLHVMLAVSDTGVGMDKDTREHLFEPFFTTKGVGKGTGLGLATVYGIVKQSSGHIEVYSTPGEGARFEIYLPRVGEVSETANPGCVRPEPPTGGETVLLVEDEEGVRDLTHEILQMHGYTVLVAAHPDEALRIARTYTEPIHLLLTDVVMPGMSGRTLAEALASLRPKAKVLYMSGYTDDVIGHHGVLQNRSAFIEKPFTSAALARKARAVLDAPAEAYTLSGQVREAGACP